MLTINEAAGDSLRIAKMLLNRANRLHELVRLNAPKVVIESERVLVLEAILAFPVDLESQVQHQKNVAFSKAAEDEHLLKTGYYDV